MLATRDETFIGTLDAEECAIVLGNLLLTYSLELRHDIAGVIGGHRPDVLASINRRATSAPGSSVTPTTERSVKHYSMPRVTPPTGGSPGDRRRMTRAMARIALRGPQHLACPGSLRCDRLPRQ